MTAQQRQRIELVRKKLDEVISCDCELYPAIRRPSSLEHQIEKVHDELNVVERILHERV